jgi:exodeoxyribonuclease I
MNQPSYLFYDLETSGLNPCFDQVMQFAAIRTDLALNEIDRCEFFVKLNMDVRPSPYALITHQIGLDEIINSDPEHQAIQRIHNLFNTPGTISLGYNTLGFDDEFLRFSFFRNLLTPYTHQYANQCGRLDIYPITVMYYLFSNNTLKWPNKDQGISMKLDDLNRANKFTTGQAHNALVDVVATLELARKLYNNKTMWDYVVGYFNKSEDLKRLNKLPNGISIAIDPKLGAKNNFQCLVAHIGQHQHYRNQSLWLRLDTIDFHQCSEDLIEQSFCLKKRGGEAPIILPPNERYLNQIDEDKITLANKNLKWLNSNNNKAHLLVDHYQHFKYPFVDDVDIDASLYQSDFASKKDQQLFSRFHQVEDSKKNNIIEQFSNPLYQNIGKRLLARHYPALLDQNEHEEIMSSLTKPRIDYRNKKQMSWPLCLEEINTIRNKLTLNEKQKSILTHYEHYIKEKHILA